MKKIILFSILSTSKAFAAYTPVVENTIGEKNVVNVRVHNDSDNSISCSFVITWFENVLTYKRNFGEVQIPAHEISTINFPNDPFAKISRLKSKLECE